MPTARKKKKNIKKSKNSFEAESDVSSLPLRKSSNSSEPITNRYRLPESDRLSKMGFRYHPFWKTAEEGELSLMEETYSEPPDYSTLILNKNQSAVLLASYGGGKTAGRLRLTALLKQDEDRAIKDLKKGVLPSFLPLVVQYTNFEGIRTFPEIKDHTPQLLACIAKSVYSFICEHYEIFLNLHISDREFWWAFLGTYNRGISILYDDLVQNLMSDYKREESRSSPIIKDTNLADVLSLLIKQLHKMNITSLFILVDNIDAYSPNPLILDGLMVPILNYLDIFSLSGVFWKFFLPDKLYDVVSNSQGFKTGRLGEKILRIEWEHDQDRLIKLLSARLSWASDGEIVNITHHCSQELITDLGKNTSIDKELVKMALRHTRLGPPRALLTLVDKLYRSGDQFQITISNWLNFNAEVQDELYKDSYVKDTYRSMIVGIVDDKRKAIGTAFITRSSGKVFIVTCAHVIKTLNNKGENDVVDLIHMDTNIYFQGRVVWCRPSEIKDDVDWNSFEDIGVIEPLTNLDIGSILLLEDTYNIGKYEGISDCWCFGYLKGTGSRGSYIERISCEKREGGDFVRLSQAAEDVQIDLGVSGAPLYSSHSSRIIGIIQSTSGDESGTAYLIPSYVIQSVFESLKNTTKKEE